MEVASGARSSENVEVNAKHAATERLSGEVELGHVSLPLLHSEIIPQKSFQEIARAVIISTTDEKGVLFAHSKQSRPKSNIVKVGKNLDNID